ncbi:hypothetical protein [Marinobacter oulmenensis]|uniref:SCP2 domain-containing protein n=1 Tax=Marinobacter oulmenensis TaxID=643747 RepID=A0A840UHL4_9GAMM|nr:hypothetical protein [Marinobacter oulmenensis]MBB5320287.1 hypothetical protein [Marinobacter oulmenensis]
MPHQRLPLRFRLRRLYVTVMFAVMGRALQALSEVDRQSRREITALPHGFVFELTVMPDGPGLAVEHTGNGHLVYHRQPAGPVDLSIRFKHISHAFRVVAFQEKTAVSFASERMVVDGNIAFAVRLTRVINRMETFILPRALAKRAVKEYPSDLPITEKATTAARIYLRILTHPAGTPRTQ